MCCKHATKGPRSYISTWAKQSQGLPSQTSYVANGAAATAKVSVFCVVLFNHVKDEAKLPTSMDVPVYGYIEKTMFGHSRFCDLLRV